MDYTTNHQHIGTICIFKLITGIPCPGCGMGRASLSILRGNIIESFSYNILCIPFSICVFTSLCWLIVDLFKGKDTFFITINRKVPFFYLIPLFILTAISWAVNIYRGI